jgi:hypothetical protein
MEAVSDYLLYLVYQRTGTLEMWIRPHMGKRVLAGAGGLISASVDASMDGAEERDNPFRSMPGGKPKTLRGMDCSRVY